MTDASFYGSAYAPAENNGQHMSGITVPQKDSMQTDLSTKAAQHSAPLTIKNIQATVAEHFGLRRNDILSDSRGGTAVPRHVARWMSYRYTLKPVSEIARRFEVTHPTITRSICRIDLLRQQNPRIAHVLTAIEARLNNLA